MLLRCCLMLLSLIVVRNFLYLLNLYSNLDRGIFMPCLCDQFFTFIFILITLNRSFNLVNIDTLNL